MGVPHTSTQCYEKFFNIIKDFFNKGNNKGKNKVEASKTALIPLVKIVNIVINNILSKESKRLVPHL